jgi:hypothetical protein
MVEGDGVGAIRALECDLELLEPDPLRLFGVALRLLDLADHS